MGRVPSPLAHGSTPWSAGRRRRGVHRGARQSTLRSDPPREMPTVQGPWLVRETLQRCVEWLPGMGVTPPATVGRSRGSRTLQSAPVEPDHRPRTLLVPLGCGKAGGWHPTSLDHCSSETKQHSNQEQGEAEPTQNRCCGPRSGRRCVHEA